MQQTVFPISLHLVNLFYMCLHECLNALSMDAIIQSIFRFAAVASPGETIRLLATVSTLLGQQLHDLPSSIGDPSWRIINITSKFGTIVFKVNSQEFLFQFLFLLLTTDVKNHFCQCHTVAKATILNTFFAFLSDACFRCSVSFAGALTTFAVLLSVDCRLSILRCLSLRAKCC